MKKIVAVVLLTSLFISGFSFALDIEIDDDIDHISLDMLYRSGVISLEEKEAFLNKRQGTSSLGHEESSDKKETKDSEDIVYDLNDFAIEKITQIGESAIKITFTSNIDKKALTKSYYNIYRDGKIAFKYSDFDLRILSNDKKAMVLKLKKDSFDKNLDYDFRLSSSLKSMYDVRINDGQKYSYIFSTKDIDYKNTEVISYKPYDEAFIDLEFAYEVSEDYIKDKRNYKLTFNEDRFLNIAKKIELIEDADGIARIVRVHFNKFEEKYDYKLELSGLKLANNVFRFPGGASLSRNFEVLDLDMIDNYTIKLELNTDIDYSESKGRVKIKSGALIDNFDLYDDNHMLIHLKKDAGLKDLTSYKLELIGFISKEGRTLKNISYDFLSGDNDAKDDHISIEMEEAKWVSNSFIEIKFTKPVDLSKNVSSYIRVKDEKGKSVTISSAYKSSPSVWILKVNSGSYGSKYSVKIDNLPEKGSQFRSESQTLEIMN